MQRPGVASDDTCGAPQERHQFAEVAAVQEGGGITACTNQHWRQLVIARSDVHDAAQPPSFSQLAAQSSETLRGPAFGAPATAWAQDNVTIQALLAQTGPRSGLVFLRNLQAHGSSATLRAGTQRQIAILLRDVRLACLYTLGVKNRHAKFANSGRRKTNAPPYAAEERQHDRLPQTLIIDRRP